MTATTGLTEYLVDALSAFSRNIPSMSMTIQLRLLDFLSLIVFEEPFKKPGAPQISPGYNAPLTTIDVSPKSIIIALKTLGTFSFERWLLKDFLCDCVVTYLTDEDEQIRMAAVTTCCNLMIPKKGEIITVRCYSGEVINIVLSKLLDVGVIDPKPQIRKTVHLNLDPSFDPFLSQSESVQKLFISFNDEEFEIKEQALITLGRLSPRNPAIILKNSTTTIYPSIQ